MSVDVQEKSKIRDLSAYYTPETIADVLAQWVVRTGGERILEPSVGAGSLISAARRHAYLIQPRSDVRFLVCDIDPAAIEAIKPLLAERSEARAIDFLQLDPASTGLFDAVLANPPFTRNHVIEPKRRALLRERFGTLGAAGLWVHFLIHAMQFLVEGGRLAAVIPASALFSDYGRYCLERISCHFAEIELRELVDRPAWSNGAYERGALLFADGFELGASDPPIPERWSASGTPAPPLPISGGAFDQLAAQATSLGDIAGLSIGAVTGNNRVFLLNEDDRQKQEISTNQLIPIVSRARHVPGLTINDKNLLDLARAGEKTWLLAPTQLGEKGSGIRRQLAKISPRRRASTVWFKKRTPWWQVDYGPPCDAIFTYMNDRGPRLVLAFDDVRCTNTLHCVRFLEHVNESLRRSACLSLISTFGQLAAERLGRVYGGGLLKFELKEARSFPILQSQDVPLTAFEKADRYLADGNSAAATRVADEVLLKPLLGNDFEHTVHLLRQEIDARQAERRGYL